VSDVQRLNPHYVTTLDTWMANQSTSVASDT
jgi:cyclopropane fatty-acyl-phospholipid synthase-like methyltransferase